MESDRMPLTNESYGRSWVGTNFYYCYL
uniref:Uncharacterized protein n=1 Tax=Arundo donax TaxID=35708 RepID=A0A0A9C9N5_ARUDO